MLYLLKALGILTIVITFLLTLGVFILTYKAIIFLIGVGALLVFILAIVVKLLSPSKE